MSRVLAKVFPLKADLALINALSEFENSLPKEQKAIFRMRRSTTPTSQDVQQFVAEFDGCTSKNSRVFGTRFFNFVTVVQSFAALGDILVGGSQNLVACGVWSLVRMSLMSVVSFSAHLEKISSLFMDYGRSTPRHENIVLLYPRSKTLQTHLCEYHIVVVQLCRYLYEYGQKSPIQQYMASLDYQKLRGFKDDLDICANSIKAQAVICEAHENERFRTLTTASLDSTSQQRIRMRVLEFCSTHDHKTPWKQLKQTGRASFFRQQPEYKEWKDSPHTSTLLYRGQLGSGKSVLLANIVDDLSLSIQVERSLVTYFFSQHDVPESLQARTIIGSLARQLLLTVADLSVTAKSCEDTHTTGDSEKVLEVLLQGFSSSVKVYFVLDGLDECEAKERETLLRALRKIQEKINISVCASFREESNHGLQSITKHLLNTRIVSIPKDNPDIASFIEADLERRIQDKLLNIRDEKLKWDIQKALLEGSSGMFLWVDLQIRTLCSLNTDYAIRKALLDLPRDISETHARILQKSGSSDPELQAKTLQLVLAARRPLTEDELLEALSVVPGDADYDPSKILNNADAALGHCGCLLVTDEEELTVRVVHRSVKQYLLNGSESAKHRKFSEEEACRTLADVVITYLSYRALEGEISKPNSQQKTSQIAPLRMLQNPEFPETPQRLLAKWLRAKSRSPLDVDLGSLFGAEHGHTEPKLQSTFKFQHYARKYWKNHLPHVSGKNTRIVEMSAQLMLKRADDRDWTRWKQTFEEGHETITLLFIHAGKIAPRPRDGEGGKPLIWAAEKGYEDTVKELLRFGGADVNAKDKNGWTSLMHAAFKGRSDIVETLLSVSGVEVDVICGGRTPLMQAARSGHKDTVKILLSDGRADIEAKDRHGYTPLLHAADCGHKDVVGMLLDIGNVDVETQDILGNTPLIQAARKGNTETVGVLLRKANAEATNNIGYTSLMVAASYGHSNTVSVLLGTADVEAKNAVGRTALIEAVRERKKDTVVLLIDMSAGKADVHAADDYGWTALMYAEDQNDEDIAEVLRQHADKLAAKQT